MLRAFFLRHLLQIICKSNAQKKEIVGLLGFVHAISAITFKAQAAVRELDAESAPYVGAQLLDQRGFKLDDLAASTTGKVIVFGSGFRFKLLSMVIAGKVTLLDQVGILEQVKRPVHSSEIEARIMSPGAAIQFLCVKMPFALLDNLQEQRALCGNAFSECAQQAARLTRGCSTRLGSVDIFKFHPHPQPSP